MFKRWITLSTQRINYHPADSVLCFVNTYPPDSDLPGGSVIQPLNNRGQNNSSAREFGILVQIHFSQGVVITKTPCVVEESPDRLYHRHTNETILLSLYSKVMLIMSPGLITGRTS